jgi:hypothetical protein
VSSRLSEGHELAGPLAAEQGQGYAWLVGVWGVVGLFLGATAIRSLSIHVGIRDPGGMFFSHRLAGSVVAFGVLACVDAAIRAQRQGRGLRRSATVLRERWPRDRLFVALTGLVAYYVVYLCYRNLKSWNAFNAPRDAMLLRVDKVLFWGHSPAVLLHDLLGQHWAGYFLAAVYESFSTWVPLSVVGALVFSDRVRDGYVFVMSAIWVWILGVGCYYLIPSIGPFASAPHDFAGLPHTGITATQLQYLGERLYLIQHPADSDAFSQLSAFASLHVGFTCMALLTLRGFGFRRTTNVLAVYLGAVMLATVYWGWHFGVDDLAGIAVAYAAVRLGRLVVYAVPVVSRSRLPS